MSFSITSEECDILRYAVMGYVHRFDVILHDFFCCVPVTVLTKTSQIWIQNGGCSNPLDKSNSACRKNYAMIFLPIM